ncbi:hypothetical protein [Streptomyces griseorubiginosus]|uniref:hypothetical protein n=1 Tax=Streptomyces griseorubiginosus TaxID=67304 RepID=UPI00331FD5A2
MASDTVPAAVPAPHDPPPHPAHAPTAGPAGSGQQSGRTGLAGLLAAVEPARPGFDLPPATTDPTTDALAGLGVGGGASSADFTHDPTAATADGTGKNTTSGQDKGIWRTWMLALAKRHEQAGAARLKALDIQKARATALQVKEQRTTNRSEKIVGGNTSSGTNTQAKADKNAGTRTSASKGDHKNHRNHDAKNNRTNQSGRSGTGGGSGSSGGHGAGGGKGPSGGRGTGNSGTDKSAGKGTSKPDNPKPNSSGSGSGSGGGKGSAGKDGSSSKPGQSGKDGKTPTNTSSSGSGGAASSGGTGKDKPKTTTSTCGTGSGIDMTKPRKDAPRPKDTSGGKSSNGTAAGAGGAAGPTSTGKTQTPPSTKPDLKKTPDPKNNTNGQPKNPAAAPDAKKPATPTNDPKQPGTGRVAIDTQAAREAGYNTGTRIGGIEAQLGALRDGIRDGRADVKEAADREKTRLDKAHADWKQQPPPQTIPPKPTQPPTIPPRPKDPPMTTAPATGTQPTQAQATPIQVQNINASTLLLGDGAARSTISRGEVRTLKHFERALDTRTATLTKAAENTKIRHAEAVEYATKASKLLEEAKAVKGGDKLATTLTRLQETAQLQAAKAEETHRRAVRAADTCRALVANLKTRYEPLYQAVVNSPETSPAETNFYLGDHSA